METATPAVGTDRRTLLDALAAHRIPLSQLDLPGLPRLLVSPRPGSGGVGVAVAAPAGFRSELPGEEGLAHLLEHLMFRSGEEDGGFVDRVHRRGGSTNASTHLDHTLYWQELPRRALEEALRDEAARFSDPLITPAAVARQREIVLEEIASNVENQPLGGFPWARLPAVAFLDHANRHNGYGTRESLAAATAESAGGFWSRLYDPRRLSVAVVGDTSVEEVREILLRAWPAAPPRAVSAPPSPGRFRPGRYRETDPFVTAPAVAVGWPVPPAETDPFGHATTMLLADVLGGGGESRLHKRLVQETGLARMASCYVGFNDPLQCRSPMLLVAEAHLAEGADPDHAVALIERTVADVGAHAEDDAVAGAALFSLLAFWRGLESSTGLARALAAHSVLHGSADRLCAHPTLVPRVGARQVERCATELLTTEPAVLVVLPEKGR
ncbi:putative Zn-dependent peptidase [Streptomyces sp. V4I23]|uniref:M16 family metallopeptidase n=1 Tax=Streptomyces sp. V4I23 TaxID=3042282 RepID=UPI00278A910E|nr:pitrilysin family protein [Streptomyces sp. V4I23]MDQ1007698.1 putative Zn-dependent peptidase [Streptomyces sp. V4I23]